MKHVGISAIVVSAYAIAVTITTLKADAVIAIANTLVPHASAALPFIIIKKPEFNAILLATALFKSHIKDLDTQTKILHTSLIPKTPASCLALVLLPHKLNCPQSLLRAVRYYPITPIT